MIPEEITVEVTEHHIRAGRPGQPHCCPVAVALMEQTGEQPVMVGPTFITIGNCSNIYEVPEHVARWMRDYDWSADAKPITFNLKRRGNIYAQRKG